MWKFPNGSIFWKFCRKKEVYWLLDNGNLRVLSKGFFTEERPKNCATISPVSGEVVLVMDAIIISP